METKLVRYQKEVCTDSNIIDHYLSEIRNETKPATNGDRFF